MYECVMAMKGHDGKGCILADEMYAVQLSGILWPLTGILCRGMGKTLQVRHTLSQAMYHAYKD